MKLRDSAFLAAACAALLVSRAAADDAAPAAPPGEKVTLALTPEPGERFANEITLNTNITTMGIEMEMDVNQFVVVQVGDIAQDGSFSLKNKIARVWGHMTNPMLGDIDFDSDKPQEPADGDDQMAVMKTKLTGAFMATAGKVMVLRMSRNGAIGTLEAAGLPNAEQMAKNLDGLGKLPDKPVGVGESWTTDVDRDLQGFHMKIKFKNTVRAIDADAVTVEQEGTMESSGSAAASPSDPRAALMARMKMKSSSVKGTLRISRKDGMALASDVEMNLEMAMDAGDKPEDQTLPKGFEMGAKVKSHIERKPAPPESEKPAGAKPDDKAAPAPIPPVPAPGADGK